MTYIQFSAIIGILIGLYFIFFRHGYSKRALNKLNDESKKEKNAGCLKQLKKMKLEGILSNFIKILVASVGVLLILSYIPTFFPKSRRVIYIIIEFFVFSYFSIGAAGVVMGTLLRRFLFKETDRYTHNKDALERFARYGSVRNYSEKPGLDAENSQQTDPILRALHKKLLIKATICFVVLYIIFLSSFFTLVKMVK